MGDFNCPNFVCTDQTSRDLEANLVLNFGDSLGLSQHNSVKNSLGHLLDLVLCEFHCDVSQCPVPLLRESMHYPALVIKVHPHHKRKFPRENNDNSNTNRVYNFGKVDPVIIRAGLSSVQWDDLLECTDVNIGCELLYKKIFDLFDVIVPSCPYKNQTNHFPAWYTRQIKSDLELKEKHRIKSIENDSDFHRDQYMALRKKTKHDVGLAYKHHLQLVENLLLKRTQRAFGNLPTRLRVYLGSQNIW